MILPKFTLSAGCFGCFGCFLGVGVNLIQREVAIDQLYMFRVSVYQTL